MSIDSERSIDNALGSSGVDSDVETLNVIDSVNSPITESTQPASESVNRVSDEQSSSPPADESLPIEPSLPVVSPRFERAGSPPPLTMPNLSNLPDLILHSPSSQIVGTPFATNSSRFEYPFPDSSASTSTTPEPSLAAVSNSFASSSFTNLSSHSSSLSNSPPTLSHFSTASFAPPVDLPSYSPTHPKHRTPNPPIPPSLAKKKHRWSLSNIGRRRSSTGSQTSEGSKGAMSNSVPSIGSIVEIGDGSSSSGGDGRHNGDAPEESADPSAAAS